MIADICGSTTTKATILLARENSWIYVGESLEKKTIWGLEQDWKLP
jgi:hypothetical protein